MAWDPPWDTAIHGSHAPGVGAGEPRASAATRRVEGAPAAAAAHGDGPDVLGRAVEALEELAEFAADGGARDRGRLAPAGVQALLGVEESTPTRSARDQDGAPRSDSADQQRQSSLGCAEDSRRAAEAGPDGKRSAARARPILTSKIENLEIAQKGQVLSLWDNPRIQALESELRHWL